MKGLYVMLRVIHALILRETRTRHGTHKLGYVWAILDPAVGIGEFALLYYLTGARFPFGDAISFLGTGFMTFNMFKMVSGRAMGAIEGNKGLLYYQQVRPLDIVIARTVLEALTLFVVFTILMGVNGFIQQDFEVDNPLLTLLGFALAAGIGGSFGLVTCSITVFYPTFERVEAYAVRPMLWLSGVFYTANGVPKFVRDYLLYNPVLHCTELVRDGWFREYTALYASVAYPLSFIIVFAFIGLTLERAARRRLGDD